MSMPRFPNGLLSIYRGQFTLSNFQMAASKPSKLDPLFRHEFFTIFTVVKILAKFETRRKIIKASLLWNCLPYPLLKNEKKLHKKCLSKHPYSKKPSLPCENPDRTPVYSFHSWQTNWLSCHVNIVPGRFLLYFKNLSDIVWSVYLVRNKSKWKRM